MNRKFILCTLAAVAILATSASASTENMEKVEESTESPIADMAMIDTELKTSTERPPTSDVIIDNSDKPEKAEEKPQSQRHTVADFIIHPLIAFKPRNPEDDSPVGKQAPSSSTTASPWQLFGFNPGQGLGSSVSSLAGSVSGWLNDRIQLPGLVDTPVRESSTTTTTTTTQRPDVVVRVQQRPQSSRRPVIRINNRNRPNRVDFDSFEDDDEEEEEDDDVQQQSQEEEEENDEEEQDDDEEDTGNDNRIKNDEEDEEIDDENTEENENAEENENEESEDDNEEEEVVQRPNNRRRPLQQQQQQNRRIIQQQIRVQPNRRKSGNAQRPQRRRQQPQQRVKPQQQQQNFVDDDSEVFYYGERPSMKRSQSQTGFIQRGQQNLLNQIRQFTRGQTPAEIGNTMRKPQSVSNKRRQQATLFVNRNGQTVYIAPELMNGDATQFGYSPNMVVKKRVKPSMSSLYPQPPLTTPLKRKGRPTQYITIPWAQLGIAPPDQIISLTEGMQSKPLILNIPQSAVNQMQNPNRKRKRPVMSSDAVPLLAEASLMDIFKPPKIPPSRTSNATRKPSKAGTPIHIVAKPKPNKHTSVLIPQRVRPGTIVEMAPAIEGVEQSSDAADDVNSMSDERHSNEKEFIIVGNDEEPGLTRQSQPAYDESSYVQVGGMKPYYEVLNRGGGHFALRKTGRALEQQEPIGIVNSNAGIEQKIPVQVVTEESPAIVNTFVPEVVAQNVAKTKEIPALQAMDRESTTAKKTTKVQEAVVPVVTDVKA